MDFDWVGVNSTRFDLDETGMGLDWIWIGSNWIGWDWIGVDWTEFESN